LLFGDADNDDNDGCGAEDFSSTTFAPFADVCDDDDRRRRNATHAAAPSASASTTPATTPPTMIGVLSAALPTGDAVVDDEAIKAIVLAVAVDVVDDVAVDDGDDGDAEIVTLDVGKSVVALDVNELDDDEAMRFVEEEDAGGVGDKLVVVVVGPGLSVVIVAAVDIAEAVIVVFDVLVVGDVTVAVCDCNVVGVVVVVVVSRVVDGSDVAALNVVVRALVVGLTNVNYKFVD
jgi:hypothetical protein